MIAVSWKNIKVNETRPNILSCDAAMVFLRRFRSYRNCLCSARHSTLLTAEIKEVVTMEMMLSMIFWQEELSMNNISRVFYRGKRGQSDFLRHRLGCAN
ncbi:protein of unknown function [Pseudodesulfovibrio profundus]|uniref:Uncharacterized protein n=1 Tax=Pseudodesulfovibrio profundus TaxID=57320 RepID=A0A2C8F629_9BACT|nr:protein of unknown function [Pseudodesulfovibrio profundus]